MSISRSYRGQIYPRTIFRQGDIPFCILVGLIWPFSMPKVKIFCVDKVIEGRFLIFEPFMGRMGFGNHKGQVQFPHKKKLHCQKPYV